MLLLLSLKPDQTPLKHQADHDQYLRMQHKQRAILLEMINGAFLLPIYIISWVGQFLRLKCDDVLHFFCTHVYLSSLMDQAKVIFQKIDPPGPDTRV